MRKLFNIGVVGLGYVGLPLASELSNFFNVYGYDTSKSRIEELKNFFDRYKILKKNDFFKKNKIKFTNDSSQLVNCNFFIVTVPTPVKKNNTPDMTYLEKACIKIGPYLKKDSFVVFESTVYPGATREICIPILEKYSNLKFRKDFFIGYSPERISVGDKNKNLKNITKIISSDPNNKISYIKYVYSKILKNKLYIAESIEVAEFAKVFENTQRDLNISLVNELSLICNKMNIDTKNVINAAATKWNFVKYNPGLVGGHCISVDPYYLSYKAKKIGYKTRLINAGRNVNNKMPRFVFENIKKKLNKNINLKNLKVGIMGLSFKENCKDIRNSKIFDLIDIFEKNGIKTYLHDPYVINEEVEKMYNKTITPFSYLPQRLDIIVLALKHKEYVKYGYNKILKKLKPNGIFADLKSTFDENKIEKLNFKYFCL
tara:strand:- start:361 stop:1650 length:1290 start_codon:yes stop_codon:yes gene_type:complete